MSSKEECEVMAKLKWNRHDADDFGWCWRVSQLKGNWESLSIFQREKCNVPAL